MGVFSLLTIRSELLFKVFGVLNKEILIVMSVLSNKAFSELLPLLFTELTESVTCRRFSDLIYLKLISKLLYQKISVTFYGELYRYIFTSATIRLPHPQSRDSQDQETLLINVKLF